MRRNQWIAALACLNVALAVGLLLAAYRPPSALAQATGLSGNYLAVAGEIRDQYDALFIIDLKNRLLHAFMYDQSKRRLLPPDTRSLERDLRNN
jgi:hypothetical protein